MLPIYTAQIADACIRLKLPFRIAPAGIRAVFATRTMLTGQALPVRHVGSVDVFLEALELAGASASGRILVIDNASRTDEACIGDLISLECKLANMTAIVINGLHRDTDDITSVGLPVFSYGSCPTGPQRLDPRPADAFTTAHFPSFTVTADDTVFADTDGVLFIPTAHVAEVVTLAEKVRAKELKQTELAQSGTGLREQFKFSEYLSTRSTDSSYTFRQHLASIAKSIEE
jgi:regulator of RNase E activity RraA